MTAAPAHHDVVVEAAPRGALATALSLFFVTLAVWSPAVFNGFVNYDDHSYVIDNPMVASGLTLDSVRLAFSTAPMSNYHPLTWLAHAVDVSLFGFQPAGHHFMAVVLHAVNAALVFVLGLAVLRSRYAAVVVALAFALHPLRVESVAWIAERKDLLSGFFFVWCLVLWLEGRKRAQTRLLIVALVFMVAGLLSKSMLVTTPAVLLVLELGLLRRRGVSSSSRVAVLIGVAMLVAAGFSALTMRTQDDAMMSTATYSTSVRLLMVPVNLARYLAMTAWPAPLAVIHPVDPAGASALTVAAAVLVLLAITALAWRRRHIEGVLVGWLLFCGMLVPVLGLVQVGRAAVAERYTYLPHIGLFIAVVALLSSSAQHLLKARTGRAVVVAVVGGVLIVWTAVTLRQVPVWRSTRTLMATSAAREPGSPFVHDALAGELLASGDVDEAIAHSTTAIAAGGTAPRYRERLAQALIVAGRLDEAEQVLRAVIADAPDATMAHFSLSVVLRRGGRIDEAITALTAARDAGRRIGDEAFVARTQKILDSVVR